MEFTHTKTAEEAAAVLANGALRIKGEGGDVIAIAARKVWLSDQTSFDSACVEESAVLFYPGDSITITF